MSEFFANNLILVLLYPLWLFILIGTARFFAVNFSNGFISVLTVLGSLAGLLFTGGAIPYILSAQSSLESVYKFLSINDFYLQLGISVDKLSIICLFLLYLISLCVQVFSVSYMKAEKKYYRFFAFLNLFNFAMSLLFVAPNLFQLYIFWELVGLVSYLLIGFKYDRVLKSVAALKTYLLNKIGDLSFLAGLVILFFVMLNYAPNRFITLDFSDFNVISALVYAHTNELTFFILCALLIIAAFVKSAQFPFNSWLLAAMEAHTPVSALIHSATLVVAGVFLVLRILPLLSLSPTIMSTLVVVGMLTAVYCSLCAIFQKKVKAVLAYSTSAHIGLMFAAIGLDNPELALVYLVVHGVIKAALFLNYGTLNNEYCSHGNQQVLLPSFYLGALALSGVFFAPVALKELFWTEVSGNLILSIEFLLTVLLGSIYIFRLSLLYTSFKKNTFDRKEFFAYWVLLVVMILFPVKKWDIGLPFFVALLGLVIAIIMVKIKIPYSKRLLITIRNGFYIDNLFSKLLPNLYSKFSNYLNQIEEGLSYSIVIIPLAKGLVKLTAKIEKYLFEFPVKLGVHFIKFASKEFDIVQTKNIQTYIAYASLIIGVIFTTVLLTYSLIIHIRGGLG